ncbi:MAG: hypothetical protein J07HX64_02501 [halophilic archaeon J07HX64]|nr:MAG: hypothetical protein J07HX64_02501 [halophilic archaeon J07HX64]
MVRTVPRTSVDNAGGTPVARAVSQTSVDNAGGARAARNGATGECEPRVIHGWRERCHG